MTVVAASLVGCGLAFGAEGAGPVGAVCNVKVVSDKVKDVSSLDAWKKAYIKDGMTDKEKGIAIWEFMVGHQYQDAPPVDYLEVGNCVKDPLKMANVYGYSLCSVVAAEVQAMARYLGMKARGYGLDNHVVAELWWNNSWHMLDASLVNYFPKPDGELASVEEIAAAVQEFFKDHPELKGADGKADDKKVEAYWLDGGTKQGWRKSPALFAKCPWYTENGWWPAKTHTWAGTMHEYAGNPPLGQGYEEGYTFGYYVNVELRPGEVLTRNWFNKGLNVNMRKDGNAPGSLGLKDKQLSKLFTSKFGDIAPGRIGNGTVVYEPPLATLKDAAYTYENLAVADGKLRLADAAKPGVLVIRMPCSYVYMGGEATLDAAVGDGGSIKVKYSDNNGLDWTDKDLPRISKTGAQKIDLRRTFRSYDYYLKFEIAGKGTGLDSLKIVNDIQHSQRPLPALDKGENTITFSAGPQEGWVKIEGNTDSDIPTIIPNYHAQFDNMKLHSVVAGNKGSITFPVTTPGDMTRLRIFGYWQGATPADGVNMQVSYDGGKSFKDAVKFGKSEPCDSRYVEVTDIPAGTKSALVRYELNKANTVSLNNYCTYADYKMPAAGFAPIKITYTWTEKDAQGKDVLKTDEHVAATATDTYKITCDGEPMMKSITVQMADTK
jgi:hypothetical protein